LYTKQFENSEFFLINDVIELDASSCGLGEAYVLAPYVLAAKISVVV
jgi:hypothetical protein